MKTKRKYFFVGWVLKKSKKCFKIPNNFSSFSVLFFLVSTVFFSLLYLILKFKSLFHSSIVTWFFFLHFLISYHSVTFQHFFFFLFSLNFFFFLYLCLFSLNGHSQFNLYRFIGQSISHSFLFCYSLNKFFFFCFFFY